MSYHQHGSLILFHFSGRPSAVLINSEHVVSLYLMYLYFLFYAQIIRMIGCTGQDFLSKISFEQKNYISFWRANRNHRCSCVGMYVSMYHKINYFPYVIIVLTTVLPKVLFTKTLYTLQSLQTFYATF